MFSLYRDELCAAKNAEPEIKRQRHGSPAEDSNKVPLAPEICQMQPFLPDDLITEILARLPVSSCLRFKSVCKLWCGIIQERRFIDEHRRHRKYNGKIEIYKEDTDFCGAKGETWRYLANNHGLLLEKEEMTDTHRIRNPATKQILQLPSPPGGMVAAMHIIYLPTFDKYKVAYIYYNEAKEFGFCGVLTLGTDLNWRSIDIPRSSKFQGCDKKGTSTKRIADVLFLARYGFSEVVCIEMQTECITTVEIPPAFFSDWEDIRAFRWNDKFSLARVERERLNIWVLENYKKQKWAERKEVISLEFMRKFPDMRKLRYHELKNNWLWIFAADDNQIAYHVRAERVELYPPLPGKTFSYSYVPSLVHIQGMQKMDKDDRNVLPQKRESAYVWVSCLTVFSYVFFKCSGNFFFCR